VERKNEPTNVSLCGAALPAKRLSLLIVWLYTETIHMYVLIFMEKIREQGVSICCLDDAKKYILVSIWFMRWLQ
jgi:hypothetical protein